MDSTNVFLRVAVYMTATFIVMRVFGWVDWSWWAVFAPLLVWFGYLTFAGVILLVFEISYAIFWR